MKSFRAALVGTAMVLTLAACGGDETGSAALPPVTDATVQAPVTSADTGPDGPTSGGAAIEPSELVAAIAAGYADVTTMTGSINSEVSGQTQKVTFQQELAGGKAVAMNMDMDIVGTQMQIILVDGKIYISGALADQYAGGKKFVEVSADSKDPALKELYTTFATSIDQASAEQYQNLLGIVTDVTDEGPDDVDGVPANKYAAVVDLSDLAGSTLDDTTKQSMQALVDLGVTEFPMTMWLDEAGRMIQVVQAIDVMGQSALTTVTMSGFNEPVDIVAPDPADIGQG